jgi:hypothetical protein
MPTEPEKAYYKAIQSLTDKDYSAVLGFLKAAEIQFADDHDFRILKGTTRLLLAVKDEIHELENANLK